MTAFATWCDFLGPVEGGFSNDPRDPGNWTGGTQGRGELIGTKFGIAASAHPNLDIQNLTIDQANSLRKSEYWDKVRGDELPPGLALLLADAAYGSGTRTAILHLQAALGGLTVDGIFGKDTMAAVNGANIAKLMPTYCAWRLIFLDELSNWPTYRHGWVKRLFNSLSLAISLQSQPAPIVAPTASGAKHMFDLSGIADMIKTIAQRADTDMMPQIPGIAPKTKAQIDTYIQGVAVAADALVQADNPQAAGGNLNRAVSDASAVVMAITSLPLPIPPPIMIALRIAGVMLPGINMAGQMLIAQMHKNAPPGSIAPVVQPA